MKKFLLLSLIILFMLPIFSFAKESKGNRVSHEFNIMAMSANIAEYQGSIGSPAEPCGAEYRSRNILCC